MEVRGKVPYEAAISSATHGTWIKLTFFSLEVGKDDVRFVQVISLSALHGPPRGPWYSVEVKDQDNNRYSLEIYLARNEREGDRIVFTSESRMRTPA